MKYEMWAKAVPAEITGDSLWKMEAYRLALFAADLGWHDVTKLAGDRRTLDLCGPDVPCSWLDRGEPRGRLFARQRQGPCPVL